MSIISLKTMKSLVIDTIKESQSDTWNMFMKQIDNKETTFIQFGVYITNDESVEVLNKESKEFKSDLIHGMVRCFYNHKIVEKENKSAIDTILDDYVINVFWAKKNLSLTVFFMCAVPRKRKTGKVLMDCFGVGSKKSLD